ncbi:UNVERIFIED_CONTAM: hypothetical protein Scaly_0054400 [Sesamum calycinum]|uniref:Uncharacterized protein n=1 Tax=Sesamum calycinum TaxID=2727403 RepID=A0AAW2SVB8_9LAMI
MVTNTITLEEQIANLTRAIENLAKHVQEQDFQINKLMNKIYNTDASYNGEKQLEAHEEGETSLSQQSNEREKSSTKELQISSDSKDILDDEQNTPLLRVENSKHEQKRLGATKHWLLCSEVASVLCGHILVLDDGYRRLGDHKEYCKVASASRSQILSFCIYSRNAQFHERIMVS